MRKAALLIDGGHLREVAKAQGYRYREPDFIEKVARSCFADDEDPYRILYYDCPPYSGSPKPKPITGALHRFEAQDQWLRELATRELFAVREGELHWRGWKLAKPA